MTFLEAKKIVEGKGYHVVKNSEGETFRQRVAREELKEAMKIVKHAGLKVVNENDLTNFAQFDSNGNITATQDFEDDKMILSANFNDNTDDEDMSPYDAELTIQFKKKFRTAHHVERHIYNALCRKLQQFGYTDAMDDSYNNGKTKTLKFNFFFDDNTNAETIINIMVRSAKLWTAQLGESVEPAKKKLLNEDEESAYETALMDKNFTDFVGSISNNNDYDANEEKYASWVDKLVNEEGWDVYDAIDHVISKNWSEYYDEILDRALDNDDISTEEAERIADLVATPLSSIDYEEVLADPSLYKDEDIDESCCCGGGKKKKGKKKGKKSGFVPFWAKKKDKVDEAFGDDLDLEGMTLDEGFGTAGGTPLSQLCEEYIRDGYFTKLAAEIGLDAAKAEFLEKARKVTGDKYYKTLYSRIMGAKTPTAVLFVIQGTMFGGSNMDLAAGTRQSAYHRNRR
jgi:hypothetical protein